MKEVWDNAAETACKNSRYVRFSRDYPNFDCGFWIMPKQLKDANPTYPERTMVADDVEIQECKLLSTGIPCNCCGQ